jgi:hypothetical protein
MRASRVALCLLLCFPASLLAAKKLDDFRDATPDERAMTTYAKAPGVAAVILDWAIVRNDERSIQSEYLRIKILEDEGKKYGDIELKYLPGFSYVDHIEARTTEPDGTVVSFHGKVYDKVVVKVFGAKLMAKTLTLPDVRKGSIIEYRYTESWPYATLLNTSWTVQRDIPVANAHFYLKPFQGEFSSFFAHMGLPPGKKPEKIGDHFELDLVDIPAFEEEPFAPDAEILKSHVNFFYTRGKPDADAFWNTTGAEWATSIENFIGNRAAVRTAAQELTHGAPAPLEKLRRLYARVQGMRNLTYETTKTAQELNREKLRDNKSGEDVLRNGYGYRSELNRLFVGLARAAGFENAVVARVSDKNEIFAKVIPDSSQLDNEIAVIEVEGKTLYLDPGTPFLPFGLLPWSNSPAVGLRIAPKNASSWIDTPNQEATTALTERNADLTLEGDVVKGKITIRYNGQEAVVQRLTGREDDEAANRKRIEDGVKDEFPEGSTVKLTSLAGLRASEEPLVAEFDVDIMNLGTMSGSRILLPLSVFAASQKHPFPTEHRKHPISYPYAWTTKDRVVLAIPEGYDVEALPAPLNINAGAAIYASQWKREDKRIVLERTLMLEATFVTADRYQALRTFFTRVLAADQQPLVLKKTAAKKS